MGKKLVIALAVLMLPILSFGNDISLVYTDSIVPADTADIRYDTVYSDWFYLQFQGLRYLQFASSIAAYESADDTTFDDDTMLINYQSSFDHENWTTHEIDTFIDNANSTQNSTIILDGDATVFGNYGRLMLIHFDSIDVGDGDSSLVNRSAPFKKLVKLYVVER